MILKMMHFILILTFGFTLTAKAAPIKIARGCVIEVAALDKKSVTQRDGYDLAVQLNQYFPQILSVALERVVREHPGLSAADTWQRTASEMLRAHVDYFPGVKLDYKQKERMQAFLIAARKDPRITAQLVAATELMLPHADGSLTLNPPVLPPQLMKGPLTPEITASQEAFEKGHIFIFIAGLIAQYGTLELFGVGHAATWPVIIETLLPAELAFGTAIYWKLHNSVIPYFKMLAENRRRKKQHALEVERADQTRLDFSANLRENMLRTSKVLELEARATVGDLNVALDTPAKEEQVVPVIKDFKSKLAFLGEEFSDFDGKVFDVIQASDTLANHINSEADRYFQPATIEAIQQAAAHLQRDYARLGVIHNNSLNRDLAAPLALMTQDLTTKIERLSKMEVAAHDLKLILLATFNSETAALDLTADSRDLATTLNTVKTMGEALSRAEVLLHNLKVNTRAIDETLIDFSRVINTPFNIASLERDTAQTALSPDAAAKVVEQLKALTSAAAKTSP